MTRSDAMSRIRAKLTFRSSGTTLNNEIVEALQAAQRDLEKGKTLPFWLKSEDQPLTYSANDPEVALPTDFLREIDDERVWWDGDSDTDARELEKGDFNQLKRLWVSNTTEFDPFAYALRKESLWLFPTPSTAGTLTWSYYAKAAILDDDSDENLWLEHAPDLMIATAGLIVAADLQDAEALAKFQAMQTAAQRSEFFDTIERELAGETITMGGNN